jgi:uracil-DNA glycosylase family protein
MATARSAAPAPPVEVDPQQQPTALAACGRCALWHAATQPVPGKGPRHAPIMMVGEQPGDKEDLAGEPFVGPAGALLDSALHDAGIKRGQVFVTNAVKHFKWEARGKRRMHKTPGQREMDACHYWLEKELESVAPG